MDIILTIVAAIIVLGFLVFIHEGGHYLASRAFGVRVKEFMIGLPGPRIAKKIGETRFGVTCVPLGGYAAICGMQLGELPTHLKKVLFSIAYLGTADVEDIADACNISDDEAEAALDTLVDWGTVVEPRKTDAHRTYRMAEVRMGKRSSRRLAERVKAGSFPIAQDFAEGEARPITASQLEDFYQHEYHRQYRSLPFWKRSVILLAGIAMNLVFAMLAFVIIYSVIGFDVQNTVTGEITHITVDPLRSIQAGFMYIGMVVQAVISLFNPATAGEVINESTSIIGIAVISKQAFEQGLTTVLEFTAMISVSLGVMNLLPIPPLDGGRFVIEIFQKLARREVSNRALGTLSMIGMALMLLLFVVMINQDIQRFILGG